jgi:hypothetical protein
VYGICIDDSTPDRMFGIRQISGQAEVFMYETADNGATWVETQLTTGSTGFQAAPIPVRNAGSKLLAVYEYGTWTHYTSYSLGTKGLVAS